MLKDGGPSAVNSGAEFPWVSFSFSRSFSPCVYSTQRLVSKFGSDITDNVTWTKKQTSLFLCLASVSKVVDQWGYCQEFRLSRVEQMSSVDGNSLAATSCYNSVIFLFPDLWIFPADSSSRFVHSHHVLEAFQGNWHVMDPMENSHWKRFLLECEKMDDSICRVQWPPHFAGISLELLPIFSKE